MNTQEHLRRIKAKCQELLAIAEKITIQHAPHAQAGWRATIVVIDKLDDMPCNVADALEDLIIAAWPEELL
jgi:hypothetical protein